MITDKQAEKVFKTLETYCRTIMLNRPSDSDQEIFVCAVRYALGRRSYIVKDVTEYMHRKLPFLSDNTLIVLNRDFKENQEYENRMKQDVGAWGELYHKKMWMTLWDEIKQELVRRGREHDI